MKLDQLKVGEWGIIRRITASGAFRKRLMEMGFVENTPIFVQKHAPLNDPIEYILRGYHISLRRNEAAHVIVSKEGEDHAQNV